MAERVLETGRGTSGTENVFLLQMEKAEDGSTTGAVRRLSNGSTVPFTGLDQAFLLMHGWMDEENLLPADNAMRTFRTGYRQQPAALTGGMKAAVRYPGFGRRGDARRKEAFLVRIICRQHNSWQGEVCWKAQQLYFRSTLELMCLIHSALDPGAVRSIASPAIRAI